MIRPDTIIDVGYNLTYKKGKEIITSEIIVIGIGEVLGFEFEFENGDIVYEKDVIDIVPGANSLP